MSSEFPLEDVYLTGICATKADIDLIHDRHFTDSGGKSSERRLADNYQRPDALSGGMKNEGLLGRRRKAVVSTSARKYDFNKLWVIPYIPNPRLASLLAKVRTYARRNFFADVEPQNKLIAVFGNVLNSSPSYRNGF